MLRLLAAILWLILAGGIFVWEWSHPQNRWGGILGNRVSVAWIAVVLGLYNVAHWWIGRRPAREVVQGRRSRGPERPADPGPPDPNFNFTDEPKAPDET